MTNSTLPPAPSSWGDDARARPGVLHDGWQVPPGGITPTPDSASPSPLSSPTVSAWNPVPPPPAAPQTAAPGPRARARAQRSRRRQVPASLAALVGVVALVLGLGAGAVAGYLAGAASQVLSMAGGPSVIGPDAEVGTGPIDAPVFHVGDFTVTGLEVSADFADDFFARATITNTGDAWAGGPVEIRLRRGEEVLGAVSGEVPTLAPGEATDIELWGFDAYEPGVEQVEIRID